MRVQINSGRTIALCIAGAACATLLPGQTAPVIAALAKGPNQINLTWPAVPDAGYGYLVEVQSSSDPRYAAWTSLQPIPTATGYTCDSTVVIRNSRCNVSDPAGEHIYNPPNHGVPYWVTDANYVDPQDGSPAQFIAWGLKPKTTYSFRVRTYTGNAAPAYGPYSNVADALTAEYPARYVSAAGNDANDGKAADASHAWRTLAHATAALHCGEVLMVSGGSYSNDAIRMAQKCSATAKAVVLVNPGETATLASQPANAAHAMILSGDHLVIDGLALATPGTNAGEYDVEIAGSHNALLNVDFHAPVAPTSKWGVVMYGGNNLIYHSYLHDYGSPDPVQSVGGNGGFVLALLGWGANSNVVWSNHLTRGGHDESFCQRGCHGNRWLNNVMDGGWGQGFLAGAESGGNLFEGNVIKDVGQLVPYYKPAIELSGPDNSVRRNVVINSRTWALEVSSLSTGTASGNLVYNNVFYNSGGCYFQSSSHGYRAYYHDIVANNICYRINDLATRIYLGNLTNRIVNNTILAVDPAGKPRPEHPLIVWNQLGGSEYESARSVAVADRGFNPPFSRNAPLSVLPEFVDETGLDFHLSPSSSLLDAGLPIADLSWGGTAGSIDVGAFGFKVSKDFSRTAERSDETALKAVRSRANLQHARVIEAALLRALDLDGDEESLAILARLPAPGQGDLMERFERVREGAPDPALWETLASQPEKVLEMAGTYLDWGLTRDALELLAHKYPAGAPLLSNPLVIYYRAYCRDRLDYPYYADQDSRLAASLSPDKVTPRGPVAATVLRMAVQRDPVDAAARYLLAVLHQTEGRTPEARDQLRAVLKLRPGHADATKMLAGLGADPTPPPIRRIAPGPTGTAPATALPASNSPREIAAQALLSAVSGDVNGALRYFTAANFPKEKQEDAVREAYIELRLQRLVAMAASRQCAGMDAAITHLGDEDKSLPFTFEGFGNFIKGVRFQYLLGVAEFVCVDEKSALKRWEKLVKATPGLASPDYAYALLAMAKLDPDEARSKARTALTFMKRQIDGAPAASKGTILFNQGQLLIITGKKEEALASFRAGAEAGPAGMIEYLNRAAIR